MFKNQYRIETSRLPGWDYSSPGFYLVTICSYKRHCYFGKIINRNMQLNPLGSIAEKNWKAIPEHHKNVYLDAFVIMPNHIHGILILTNDEISVETLHATSLRSEKNLVSSYYSSISPKQGSLSTIIRSYKSSVTKHIRKHLNPTFTWQPRFYDHIIRTEVDLENLRLYIETNPQNWGNNTVQNLTIGVSAHA